LKKHLITHVQFK